MGTGDFGAGSGPAGFDPVVSTHPLTSGDQETALTVDGLARDNTLDSSGRYVKRHWVDAAAFDLLRIAKNSIASAPDTGETVSEIKFIDSDRVLAQVTDRVNLAWAILLSRQLVTVQSIEIDLSVPGRLMYRVDYINNVTGKADRAPGSLE